MKKKTKKNIIRLICGIYFLITGIGLVQRINSITKFSFFSEINPTLYKMYMFALGIPLGLALWSKLMPELEKMVK